MPSITLKNIPDALYERLRYFAKIRHRSLNSEIIYNLEKSVGMAEEDPDELARQIKAFRRGIGKKGHFSADEIQKAVSDGNA